MLCDEECRGFFQKLTVQTQFGILAAQTLQLRALIGIEHRASSPNGDDDDVVEPKIASLI